MSRPVKSRSGLVQRCENCFREQHAILWPALSRTVNLLAILNVSLFFITGAVTRGGYRYPIYSLSILALAGLLLLMPLGFHGRLWYYLSILGLCLVSGWLLGASIFYWHSHAA